MPWLRKRGGMQHELPRRFELGRHVGQAERDRLMFDDRLAEAAAFLRISDGDVVRRARHADGLRGDADAAAFEIGERDAIALAFGAEPVFRRHAELVELHLAGVGSLLAHLGFDAADAIAGPVGLDDEAADAALAEREIGRRR